MPPPPLRSTPLHGAAARDWLRARGGDADPGPALALLGQEARIRGVVLRRIWHTAGTFRFGSARWRERGAVVLLLPIEGELSVRHGDVRATVRPGGFAAMPAGAGAVLRTSAPTSRLVLLTRPAEGTAPPAGLVVSSSPAVPVLLAAAHAVLDLRLPPGDPALDGVRAALRALASAVLAGPAAATEGAAELSRVPGPSHPLDPSSSKIG